MKLIIASPRKTYTEHRLQAVADIYLKQREYTKLLSIHKQTPKTYMFYKDC